MQGSYAEAHKIQLEVQKLELEDQRRWETKKAQKVAAHQAQLLKKHAVERGAFQKKVQSRIEERKKERALKLDKILQKYQNLKKEMELRQTSELQQIQKRPGTSATSRHAVSTYTTLGSSPSQRSKIQRKTPSKQYCVFAIS